MSSLELSKNEMNSIKPHFTSLILFLSLLVQLYQTLETDQAVIDGKYNVLAQNLTAEELEFLHKVVNYDTEVNLRYLILNKTQEMYAQNYAQMYKQAEDQIVFHEDHLNIKYKLHFDEFAIFKDIYYNHLENFFYNKILHNVPSQLKRSRGHSNGNITAFLLDEEAKDLRFDRIVQILDHCLRNHYLHVDDSKYKEFFNFTREYLHRTLYKPMWKMLPEGSHQDYFHSGH